MSKTKHLPNRNWQGLLFVTLILPLAFSFQRKEKYTLDIKEKKTRILKSDSISFDGYYIILYTKREINDIERNRRRRLEGLSFEMEIDNYPIKYFVSKEEITNKGFLKIVKDLPVRDKTRLYYECNKVYIDDFYKVFNMEKKDFECNWPPFSNGNKFYTTVKKSKYCFKIFEVSCWFLTLKVDSEEKRNVMDRNIRYLQPGLRLFNAYFFLRYKSFSNDPISLKNDIRVWREQVPIFE